MCILTFFNCLNEIKVKQHKKVNFSLDEDIFINYHAP